MTHFLRNSRLRASASEKLWLACMPLALLGTAYAATPAPGAASAQVALEEIVVTAQRREERLQDVPISISAFSDQDLTQHVVTDLASLRGTVPGLSITHTAGVNASNLLTIRGVGGLPLAIGAGQATGLYLDGVYLSRVDAAFFSLDDVERIEVLRGPQGTLYGRNATAGAVNIITRDPGNTLRAGFDAGVGNYGASHLKGSVSGPLSSSFSGGLSGSYENRDGYFRNTVTGNHFDYRRSYTVRGKLRYASDDFTAMLSADNTEVTGKEPFKNGYTAGVYTGLGNVDEVTVAARNEEVTGINDKSDGVALTLNYKLNDAWDLASITSYRTLGISVSYNFSAIPGLQSFLQGTAKTLNQELRFLMTRDRVRATLGANYYGDKQKFNLQVTPAPAAGPLLMLTPIRNSSDIKSWALFGQFEYDFSDRLTGVFGARYSNENRDWVQDTTIASPPGTAVSGTIKDNAVTPTLGLNFKLQKDLLLYGKISKGYQAPGFNSGANGPTLADLLARGAPIPFGAETLLAYEAGVKSQFLDRRMTLNAAAFYYDYKDLQVRNNLGTSVATNPGSVIINNAASAKITGIEATFSAQINNYWSIAAQATSLSATYNKYCQSVSAGSPRNGAPECSATPAVTPSADRSGFTLNQAPKFSGGVAVNFDHPMGGGNLSANLQYTWESNIYYSPVNEREASSEGGWNRIDARVGYELSSGLEFYAFGKNLNDKRYVSWVTRPSATGTLVSFSEPRTYGIGVRYKLQK